MNLSLACNASRSSALERKLLLAASSHRKSLSCACSSCPVPAQSSRLEENLLPLPASSDSNQLSFFGDWSRQCAVQSTAQKPPASRLCPRARIRNLRALAFPLSSAM